MANPDPKPSEHGSWVVLPVHSHTADKESPLTRTKKRVLSNRAGLFSLVSIDSQVFYLIVTFSRFARALFSRAYVILSIVAPSKFVFLASE